MSAPFCRRTASLLLILIALIPLSIVAQSGITDELFRERGEVFFAFPKPSEDILSELATKISIDHLAEDSIFAYASKLEFIAFLQEGIPFTPHTPPGFVDFDLNMLSPEAVKSDGFPEAWDFYPTYEAYVEMMYLFEEEFPELVEIVDVGETVMGRRLLFARIHPGLPDEHSLPQFMYTSTIHGDETAGFVLSLRLIHHLVSNYGEDEEITSLMDGVEIWICPNENPDGTYRDDNNSLQGASRGNANWIDLNRNYPNPVRNPSTTQQPETTAMIAFSDTMNFIMSANMHGGIELVNYPFDSWRQHVNPHADNDWWEFVMYEYVDMVHQVSPSNYMRGMGNGVTHGGEWYVIFGGRQDFFNYYRSCREFTLELSNQKLLNPSLLPVHWEYNHRSLISYIRQATYGVHGFVYDNETGEAITAELYLPGHDANNSEVVASLPLGNYNRPLLAGNYDLAFHHPDYDSVFIDDLEVLNYERTRLNVAMGAGAGMEPVLVSLGKIGDGFVYPPEGKQYFTEGSMAFLRAEPADGWYFHSWEVNGTAYFEQELALTVAEGMEVWAAFVDEPTLLTTPRIAPFSLQVYPNPVDAGTQVLLSTDRRESISLKVYDLLGNSLETLFSGEMEAGVHRLKLGLIPGMVSPGIYILTARTASHTQSVRFVIGW